MFGVRKKREKTPSSDSSLELEVGNSQKFTGFKQNKRKRRRFWLYLGSLMFVGINSGMAYGWFFMDQQLAPLIETQLGNYLNRPVKIGSVQKISLNGVQFGASEINSTPTDPAKISLAGVDVRFNPLKLITHSQLALDITALQPDIYLQQGVNHRWLITPFDQVKKQLRFAHVTISLDTLRIKNGDVILVARDIKKQLNSPVKLVIPSGKVDFLEKGKILDFDLLAQLDKKGKLRVSGSAQTNNQEINLLVNAHQINAADLGNLIAFPFTLQKGTIGGNLEIKISSDQAFPSLQGVATFNQVTAKIPGLPQPFTKSQGQLRFNQQKIQFDQVTTHFGDLVGVAEGNLQLGGEFNLEAKTQPFLVNKALNTLKIPVPDLSMSATIEAEMKLTGVFNNPQLNIALNTTQKAKIDQIALDSIYASVSVNKSQISLTELQAIPTLGGQVTAQGNIDIKNRHSSPFSFAVTAQNIPSQKLAQLYQTILPSSVGKITAKAIIKGDIKDSQDFIAQGSASFPFAAGTVNARNIKYTNNNWQGQIQASGIHLKNLGLNLPENTPEGLINANLSVAGKDDSFTLKTIQANGTAIMAVAGGRITAYNLNLEQGQWKTDLDAQGIRVNQILSDIPAQVNGFLEGTFTLEGHIDAENIKEINATGNAQLTLPSGTIQAHNLTLHQGIWNANLNTNNLQVSRLFLHLPKALQGGLNAQINLTGNLDNFQELAGTGIANLQLASGTIIADKIELNQGRFTTILTPQQLKLAQFSPHLSGVLGGSLNIAGNLNNFNPQNFTAQGKLKFSEGISIIDQPLKVALDWNGQRLNIQKATADNFSAQGFIDVNIFQLGQTVNFLSAFNQWNLEINAVGLNLQKLPLQNRLQKSSIKLVYGGKLDFNGKIHGTPENPIIKGELAVNNLHLANLSFEPLLTGAINVVPETGVNLQLNGIKDQIQLHLNSNYQPTAFNLQLDQMQVEGTYDDHILLTTANHIPLPLLQELAVLMPVSLPEAILSQRVAGNLSGDFVFNFDNGHISGKNLTILNPGFGPISGDNLIADFQWQEGQLNLTNSQLQYNQSRYNLEGNLIFTASEPHLQGKISIADGQIQDVLETLEVFQLSYFQLDANSNQYGKAADLWTQAKPQSSDTPQPLFSLGLPNGTLGENLHYYQQFNAWREKSEKEQRGVSALPKLSKLTGKFDGQLTINASLQQGIEAQFNLQGNSWQWGNLNLDQLTAKGNFKNGQLTLEPVSLRQGKSILAFTGQINPENQSGKLQLVNIPLEKIQKLISFPTDVNIQGLLNANIDLSGTRDNPNIIGKLAIDQGIINQTPLPTTQGEFIYYNSRLSFHTESFLAQNITPIKLEGSLPYQLPFAKVLPASEQLLLNIRIKNEGLALLDVISKGELNWLGGQGEVNLDIVGKFDQKQGRPSDLRADGVLILENGTIAGKILPSIPLTDVNGKISFNFDQLEVEHFRGNFSGGQVTIAGILPLVKTNAVNHPLTINTDNIILNIENFYRGGVNGNIQITGSLFNPVIGGEVNLFDGQILVGETIANDVQEQAKSNQKTTSPQFNQLQLNLGDNLWVSSPPVLNFLATGNLIVNGSLEQPRPQGKIKLKAGQVNLFAAQFGLVGGEANIAEFKPSRGLDPYLDLQLLAVATETTRNAVRTNPLSSEINDNTAFPSDSLQTIRIQATIKGFASQLGNSLELSSQPFRSKTEIVSLLGGNFINTFEQGDPALGLANLAGTAVFGRLQGSISKALGLSDFRIYSTPLINEKERISDVQLGVAAEASIDVGSNLSVSVQKILNTERPPQFGLRYRINEHTVIRGSSNFSDDSRGIIEYERRF
jgi:translocation and assembly module TamB